MVAETPLNLADRAKHGDAVMKMPDRLDNQRKMDNSEIERAWPSGPLRRIGTGNGSPSTYVCGDCRRSVAGLYFVEARRGTQERWVCEGCRAAATEEGAA
jgi:hypothetical protein